MGYTNNDASRYNGKVPMRLVLDCDLADLIDEEARKMRISKSALLRIIVAQWAEANKQQEGNK